MDEVVTEFSPKEGAGTVSDRLSEKYIFARR